MFRASVRLKYRSALKGSGKLFSPIVTVVSFRLSWEEVPQDVCFTSTPYPLSTNHTHTHTHTPPKQGFFPPFTSFCQVNLIPNVLYQNGPHLSTTKRISINFLQENHDTHPEVHGCFFHLFKKLHSTRTLLCML